MYSILINNKFKRSKNRQSRQGLIIGRSHIQVFVLTDSWISYAEQEYMNYISNTEARYNNALFFIKLYTADEEK